MTEQEQGRAPRSRGRAVTAAVLAGGLTLAGGAAAFASSGHDGGRAATPAAAKPAAKPAATTPADDHDAAYDAYWGAGYDEYDGQLLADLWHEDYFQAKVDAGRKLLAGEQLPIKPGDGDVKYLPKTDAAVQAFFRAGYDYDDAVRLSKLWHTEDAYGAKVEAGKKLLAHESLPFKP